MNPRERTNDPRVAISSAILGRQAQMWTALPAKVVSYNSVNQTIQAKPTIVMQINNPLTGGTSLQPIPVINDIPVVFPGGGGFTLTFPLLAGDECLLIFASRCIDNWWYQGGYQQQGDLRMHDLSDGFALVGPRSRPNAISSPSTSAVQLRDPAGTTYVEVNNAGQITVKAAVSIALVAPPNTITANGNVIG